MLLVLCTAHRDRLDNTRSGSRRPSYSRHVDIDLETMMKQWIVGGMVVSAAGLSIYWRTRREELDEAPLAQEGWSQTA
jgi:hypothetical protein